MFSKFPYIHINFVTIKRVTCLLDWPFSRTLSFPHLHPFQNRVSLKWMLTFQFQCLVKQCIPINNDSILIPCSLYFQVSMDSILTRDGMDELYWMSIYLIYVHCGQLAGHSKMQFWIHHTVKKMDSFRNLCCSNRSLSDLRATIIISHKSDSDRLVQHDFYNL